MTRVPQRVQIVEQEVKYPYGAPQFTPNLLWVYVAQSLLHCVVFSRTLVDIFKLSYKTALPIIRDGRIFLTHGERLHVTDPFITLRGGEGLDP